ncbi:MAG: DUF2889 domain-containing protein [Rhodospirillales bacterium]|nr:DUF2889 domain-containing protein [Rhodospirillales bacterium]MCW8861320.1 DUF2889 domain-containing protein [Rhodospirillales bacterium]MCW8951074.1 DUF2889 domain-containing protein [Rhodospirillales bacterium]MCW8971225.1 DUF2889 domain-containing protein [Rhodospirillales bacterium]
MPLSEPTARKHQHTRNIEFKGYEREDGLWDIEGRITDTKTYSFDNQDRGTIHAGEPIHDMWVRVTVDDELVVRSVETAMEAGPYNLCSDIAPAFRALEGLKIGPGWFRKVKEAVGGVKGCTHVVEMLGPLATATLQTLYPALSRKLEKTPPEKRGKPFQLDGCHALASDSLIVKDRWPEHYRGK